MSERDARAALAPTAGLTMLGGDAAVCSGGVCSVPPAATTADQGDAEMSATTAS
ncbi:hypothetical protein FM119_11280 [Mycetocola reblochoni REB411]|uniref:Uncharacterized protein n=1 Tax=Mycetocola reblochoni REB411 TaxID=1255698 RepID=A0A1R4K493_9MICO|nr:hypothetical protein FM119_11280 [Mycetocola reblochoni REB411]